MRYRRLWAMFIARNREFFRDRSAFGWNFLFPFLIILGFAVIFKGDYQSTFKVGVFPVDSTADAQQKVGYISDAFVNDTSIALIGFGSREEGLAKLKHHKIDLLVEAGTRPVRR